MKHPHFSRDALPPKKIRKVDIPYRIGIANRYRQFVIKGLVHFLFSFLKWVQIVTAEGSRKKFTMLGDFVPVLLDHFRVHELPRKNVLDAIKVLFVLDHAPDSLVIAGVP